MIFAPSFGGGGGGPGTKPIYIARGSNFTLIKVDDDFRKSAAFSFQDKGKDKSKTKFDKHLKSKW